MLFAMLVQIIAAALFAYVYNLELYGAVTDLSCAIFIVRDITVVFIIDPYPLVLPVVGIERIKIIEEVSLPACFAAWPLAQNGP